MQFLDIKTFPKYSDRLGSKSRVLVRFEVSIYRIQAPKFLGFPRVLGFFGNPNTSLLMDLGPWIWVTKVGFE